MGLIFERPPNRTSGHHLSTRRPASQPPQKRPMCSTSAFLRHDEAAYLVRLRMVARIPPRRNQDKHTTRDVSAELHWNAAQPQWHARTRPCPLLGAGCSMAVCGLLGESIWMRSRCACESKASEIDRGAALLGSHPPPPRMFGIRRTDSPALEMIGGRGAGRLAQKALIGSELGLVGAPRPGTSTTSLA